MRRSRRLAGFTLVELVFSGVIAAGITLVALGLLLTSIDVRHDLDGRLRANHAARQTLGLIADGGSGPLGNKGDDGKSIAKGVRMGNAAATMSL
jgi:type II secretory pathway pseudopilin PulG